MITRGQRDGAELREDHVPVHLPRRSRRPSGRPRAAPRGCRGSRPGTAPSRSRTAARWRGSRWRRCRTSTLFHQLFCRNGSPIIWNSRFRPEALLALVGVRAASATPRRRRRTRPPSGTGRRSGRRPRTARAGPAARPRGSPKIIVPDEEDDGVDHEVPQRVLELVASRTGRCSSVNHDEADGLTPLAWAALWMSCHRRGRVDGEQAVDEDAEQDQGRRDEQEGRAPRADLSGHECLLSRDEHADGSGGRATDPGRAGACDAAPPRPWVTRAGTGPVMR